MNRLFKFLGCAAILFLVSSAHAQAVPAGPRLELGMNRTWLSTQPPDLKQLTLKNTHDLGILWLRDGPTSGSSRAVANLVDDLRLAKQYQLKVLLNILPMDEDYDGVLPANSCGWKEKRLSQIDMDKFSARLETLLEAVKAAGLSIDAVEFGNEMDQYCYDADVPRGHAGSATPNEIKTWLVGYGRFLQTGTNIVHDPRFFPGAMIVTFGIAHSGDYKADNAFPDPARYVAMLHNVDGIDYLKDVDGYGTHLYPSPNDITNSLRNSVNEDVAALGTGKPFWVTEWGFLDPNAFPNRSGQTLTQCLQTLLGAFDALPANIHIGPSMFFRYDVWLSDAAGNLLPQASVFSAYTTRRLTAAPTPPARLTGPVTFGSPDLPFAKRRPVTAADRALIQQYRTKSSTYSTNFATMDSLLSEWTITVDDMPGMQSCRRAANLEPSNVGLRIKTLLATDCRKPGQNWSTGFVTSKASYGYGFYEAAFKIAPTKGMNNSIWLTSADHYEIDISETQYPNYSHLALHYWPVNHPEQSQGLGFAANYDQNLSYTFHDYGMLWTPTDMIFEVDGEPVAALSTTAVKGPLNILLSTAVADWAHGPVPAHPEGNNMVVKSVRYVALDPSAASGAK